MLAEHHQAAVAAAFWGICAFGFLLLLVFINLARHWVPAEDEPLATLRRKKP